MSHRTTHARPTLAEKARRTTGTSPRACYQCGRCSAGCPQNTKGEMDFSPTQVLRLLQMDDAMEPGSGTHLDRLLRSDTPWLCAGCQACSTRCPQGVDIAGIMDLLRQEALERGVASRSRRARRIQALHRVFLKGAVGRGRIHEVALVAFYKMASGDLFGDVLLAPSMFAKGKLHLRPGRSMNMTRAQQAIRKLRARKAAAARAGGHA